MFSYHLLLDLSIRTGNVVNLLQAVLYLFGYLSIAVQHNTFDKEERNHDVDLGQVYYFAAKMLHIHWPSKDHHRRVIKQNMTMNSCYLCSAKIVWRLTPSAPLLVEANPEVAPHVRDEGYQLTVAMPGILG